MSNQIENLREQIQKSMEEFIGEASGFSDLFDPCIWDVPDVIKKLKEVWKDQASVPSSADEYVHYQQEGIFAYQDEGEEHFFWIGLLSESGSPESIEECFVKIVPKERCSEIIDSRKQVYVDYKKAVESINKIPEF